MQAWWDKFVQFKVKRFSTESQAVLVRSELQQSYGVGGQYPGFF